MTTHIGRGHQNTTTRPKTQGKYGAQAENNEGPPPPRGFALLIVYQGDMMEDNGALIQSDRTPVKRAMGRTRDEVDQKVSTQVRTWSEKRRKEQKKHIAKQLNLGQHALRIAPLRTIQKPEPEYAQPRPCIH